MLKNKKAGEGLGMSLGAIGRAILAALAIGALILIFYSCSTKIFASTASESFEAFVSEINRIPQNNKAEEFALKLNEGSAIIGFSKDAESWECFDCYENTADSMITIKVTKPNDEACAHSACICLCDKAFEMEGEEPSIGTCKESFVCKKLENDLDITEKTVIKAFTETTDHWLNGFLFASKVLYANGLPQNTQEPTFLFVQKECIYDPIHGTYSQCSVGVCDDNILSLNERLLGLPSGTCINKGISHVMTS